MAKRNTRAAAASAAVAAGGALAAGKVVHDLVAERVERKRARRFRLVPGETPREGVLRVVGGQLDMATGLIDGRDGDAPTAIHDARKALKRIRAVLRMCRPWLGEERFRQENTILRDAGRSLSGLRDAKVLIETLDGLREPLGPDLPKGTWARFRERLVADAEALEKQTDDADHTNIRLALAGVRERLALWPLPEEGGPERLVDGLQRIYKKARNARREAKRRPTPETLHELRKRTKDVWHSAQLLEPLAPKRVRKLKRRAHRVSDLLGDDHDLVVLLERAEQMPDAFGAGELELLSTLAERQRRELERKALARAGKLYRRKPRKLARRLRVA